MTSTVSEGVRGVRASRARPVCTRSAIAAAVALALSGVAAAQTAAKQEGQVDEVLVTGTRIQQTSGMDTPTPVAALSVTEINNMAPGPITNALTELPQFYASATAATFNGANNGFFNSPGGGSLNLRGIGSKRTLTLLDGRRVVSATIYGGPDINSFPKAMLKSVETVTGGASAAYGTDAVSGVVNFILNTDFNGFDGQAEHGQSFRGDGDNSDYSAAFGMKIGSRAHLLLSAEHTEQDAITTFKGRDWYQGWGMLQTGGGTSPSDPRLTPAPHMVSSAASYDGIALTWFNNAGAAVPGFGVSAFNSDGTLSPYVYSNRVSSATYSQSLDGVNGSGNDNNTDRPLLEAGSTYSNGFAYFDIDATDNLNIYAQGIYSKQVLVGNNLGGVFCPAVTGCQGNAGITIYANNAFLPDSVRQQMVANGIGSFAMGRIGYSSDLAGNAVTENDGQTRSGTVGFKSTIASDGFFSGWKINGYYQYGKTNLDAVQEGGIRMDRLYEALDAVVDPATGRIVCNASLPANSKYKDCVPLNLFGRGRASKEAIDYVTGFDPGVHVSTTPYLPGYPPFTYSYTGDENKHRLIEIEQDSAEVSASGKVVDGWAGPISAAVGADYRKEKLDQRVQASQGNPAADPLNFTVVPGNNAALNIRGVPAGAFANSVEFQFSKVPFARGSYDIKEMFTEGLVPLFSGASWLKQLNLNAAARWADYGGSGTIWTYKAGLDSTFTDDFRVRGTYSRDVRAANLGERFDRTGGAGSVHDPRGPATAANVPVTLLQGGNPNVQPETADTYTAGFVYRPQWLDGFDVSVDWLSVNLKDSIEQFGAQDIVNACYINNDPDQCKNINLNTDGTFNLINQTYQNVSKAKISGVDAEFGYTRAVDWLGGGERISTRVFASYLDENSTTGSTGVKIDRAGQVNLFALPKKKATASFSYMNGPLTTFLQLRYIGPGVYDTQNGIPTATTKNTWSVADNSIGSITYLDVRLSYDIKVSDSSVQLYASGSNLMDRDPPIIPSYGAAVAAPAQFNAGLYDVLGRRFVVGLDVKF